jgi:hypothetical protein
MMPTVAIPVILFLAVTFPAMGDTFGGGANAFDIEFVTIGNPGNAADTSRLRAVLSESSVWCSRLGRWSVAQVSDQ